MIVSRKGFLGSLVAAAVGSRFVSLIAEKGHHVTTYIHDGGEYRSENGDRLNRKDVGDIGYRGTARRR